MTVLQSGRLLFPADAVAARHWAAGNLCSIHGRRARLAAIMRGPRIECSSATLSEEEMSLLSEPLFGGRSEWIVLRDYPGDKRLRTIAFLFDEGGLEPVVVLKTRPIAGPGESLEREATLLASVARRLPSTLASSVPAVEDYRTDHGRELLLLSRLPGTALAIRMQRSLAPRLSHLVSLSAAAEWLAALHGATRDAEGRTVVHGDFWPRNILFKSKRGLSGVVDWESAVDAGSPWEDLFTLPVHFTSAAPGWRSTEVQRGPDHVFGRAVEHHYFRVYARAAGVPLETIREHFSAWIAKRGHGSAHDLRAAFAQKTV